MRGVGLFSSNDATVVRDAAHPIADATDYDAIVELAGDAQFVLIGEASHGTHEFYEIRAALTRRLIEEKGFRLVALEADWPDMLRVHRYVRGLGQDTSASAALGAFTKFPQWMWRNSVVLEFVEWAREWNSRGGNEKSQVGLYGMDLYSLHASIDAVLGYLAKTDPDAAARARRRYACFEHFGEDPQTYGYATAKGVAETCEQAVIEQLIELRRKYDQANAHADEREAEELFFAEQNARLVRNAERYYRSMFRGRASSWNLRDSHMAETLNALVTRLDGGSTKVVVWAHNSHLGDARATEMGERGEHNVGQLVRERVGDAAFLIGFSTYSGSVTAASDWGEAGERKRVRPGLGGSYEELFHNVGLPRFWLNLREQNRATELLKKSRLQRAIGVIYAAATERWSHYFHARVTEQFDVMIHLDETTALQPLETTGTVVTGELPDTFPSSL
ncbi:MAG: Protein-L-isoaspartate O-methyltransferase [uncultured Chthoniobacterales bacterium]|uniref:Protein-L-isoaspartate O-methyltransferase n=1 Tax=uncultured Chthoniobacterales bacterium TaxID=1836801 RepID=A0A6J4I0W6_9BACT|nr:MAG: Protein-L-isoaspartate O-methyltransferase [uncultured Chthoniobacterales bacterium]